MIKLKNIFLLLCLLFPVGIFAVEYTIQTLPNPKTSDATNFVANPDGILKTSTIIQLNGILNSLEKDTQAEVAVVAVNSIGSEDVKNFGVKLFEKWGIGKAGADNGLLVLFVLDQRNIIIETGYGLEGIFPDAIAKRVIEQQILPEFRKGDYDAGIIAGVNRISSILREEPVAVPEKEGINWRAVLPMAIGAYIVWALLAFLWMMSGVKKVKANPKHPHNLSRYRAVKSQRQSVISIMAFILPFIALFLTFFFSNPAYALLLIPLPLMVIPAALYGKVQMKKVRTQPIPCEQCDGMMHILSERNEDTYLNEAQQLEERLGSVDYDVYKCDNCDEIKILRLDKASAYSVCPNCGTKAFIEHKKETIKQPTYSSTGIEKITSKCKYCGYEEDNNRTIPRLDRSTPILMGGLLGGLLGGGGRGGGFGGGGSFGGGRSGGGGAMGRW